MKIEDRNMREYLDSKSYKLIPIYQRSYAWTESHWRDLYDTLTEYLPKKTSNRIFGSVVLVRDSDTSMLKNNIVDGQQRTVTLLVLLLALGAHVDTLLSQERNPDQLQKLTNLKRSLMEDYIYVWDSITGIQGLSLLAPASYKSQYEDIVAKALSLERERIEEAISTKQSILPKTFSRKSTAPLIKAYNYFYDRLSNDCILPTLSGVPPQMDTEKVIKYSKNISDSLTKLLIIQISLDKEDDEQQVFEAMNTHAVPLTGADLVKNFLAYALIDKWGNPQEAISWFEKLWETEFGETFWNATGKRQISNPVFFLRAWLEATKGQLVLERFMLQEYKSLYANSTKQELQTAIVQITKMAKSLRLLLEASNNPTSNLNNEELFAYRTCIALKQTYVLPYLILLQELLEDHKITPKQYEELLTIYEGMLVRRVLIRLPNNRQVTIRLIGAIKRSVEIGKSPTDALAAAIAAESDHSAMADSKFKEAILMNARYQLKKNQSILRMLLEAAEDHERGFDDKQESKCHPNRMRRFLTIEHIYPRDPTNWISSGQNSVDLKVINSLGNLTLVDEKVNPGLSNKPWSEKKDTLKRLGISTLNTSVLNRTADWDESGINLRTNYLVDILLEVWTLP